MYARKCLHPAHTNRHERKGQRERNQTHTDAVVCVAVKLEAGEAGTRVVAVCVVAMMDTSGVLILTLIMICPHTHTHTHSAAESHPPLHLSHKPSYRRLPVPEDYLGPFRLFGSRNSELTHSHSILQDTYGRASLNNGTRMNTDK